MIFSGSFARRWSQDHETRSWRCPGLYVGFNTAAALPHLQPRQQEKEVWKTYRALGLTAAIQTGKWKAARRRAEPPRSVRTKMAAGLRYSKARLDAHGNQVQRQNLAGEIDPGEHLLDADPACAWVPPPPAMPGQHGDGLDRVGAHRRLGREHHAHRCRRGWRSRRRSPRRASAGDRSIMDSSICVAVMTGLARWLARRMMSFCTTAIRSMGTSTPEMPRCDHDAVGSVRISSSRSRARDRLDLGDENGYAHQIRAAALHRPACPQRSPTKRLAADGASHARAPANDWRRSAIRSREGSADMPRSMPEAGSALSAGAARRRHSPSRRIRRRLPAHFRRWSYTNGNNHMRASLSGCRRGCSDLGQGAQADRHAPHGPTLHPRSSGSCDWRPAGKLNSVPARACRCASSGGTNRRMISDRFNAPAPSTAAQDAFRYDRSAEVVRGELRRARKLSRRDGIHAGADHLLEHGRRAGRRADGGDDLRFVGRGARRWSFKAGVR